MSHLLIKLSIDGIEIDQQSLMYLFAGNDDLWKTFEGIRDYQAAVNKLKQEKYTPTPNVAVVDKENPLPQTAEEQRNLIVIETNGGKALAGGHIHPNSNVRVIADGGHANASNLTVGNGARVVITTSNSRSRLESEKEVEELFARMDQMQNK